MRGRKPDPALAKLRSGNRGRRPVNEHEPEHAALDPKAPPPPEIAEDELAAGEWCRPLPTLSRGHLTVTDRAAFLTYCATYSRWCQAAALARTEPSAKTLSTASATTALLVKIAAACGFTPSTRSRIVAKPIESPGAPVDEFRAFQRQRRQPRRP